MNADSESEQWQEGQKLVEEFYPSVNKKAVKMHRPHLQTNTFLLGQEMKPDP